MESVYGLSNFGLLHFENAFFNDRPVTVQDTTKFVEVTSSGKPRARGCAAITTVPSMQSSMQSMPSITTGDR